MSEINVDVQHSLRRGLGRVIRWLLFTSVVTSFLLVGALQAVLSRPYLWRRARPDELVLVLRPEQGLIGKAEGLYFATIPRKAPREKANVRRIGAVLASDRLAYLGSRVMYGPDGDLYVRLGGAKVWRIDPWRGRKRLVSRLRREPKYDGKFLGGDFCAIGDTTWYTNDDDIFLNRRGVTTRVLHYEGFVIMAGCTPDRVLVDIDEWNPKEPGKEELLWIDQDGQKKSFSALLPDSPIYKPLWRAGRLVFLTSGQGGESVCLIDDDGERILTKDQNILHAFLGCESVFVVKWWKPGKDCSVVQELNPETGGVLQSWVVPGDVIGVSERCEE